MFFTCSGDSLTVGYCLPRSVSAAADLPMKKLVKLPDGSDAELEWAESLQDLNGGSGFFYFDREASVLYG